MKNVTSMQDLKNIIRLRAPIRSSTMGSPARVLVISNEMKYPANLGSVSPRMSSSCWGWSIISANDVHKAPAVTVI
eukprot:scaffold23368_cov71-Cyclotella_meneghiniana.AAC.6